MERIYRYAIIRLIPQAHRGEQINIGFVIFNKGSLEVSLSPNLALLRAIGTDPSSLEWIPGFLSTYDNREASVDERWTALRNCPGFNLSSLGWFEAVDEDQYTLRKQFIHDEFVAHPKLRAKTPRRTSVARELSAEFKLNEIMGRHTGDLDRHKVVSNIPVGPSGKLHIDFLIRNGVYHATETADFRHAHETGTPELKEAALAAFTLKFAREQLGANSTRCYLVYAAPVHVEAVIAPAIELVKNSVDEIYNIESRDEKRAFVNKMLEAAGEKRLLS